MSIAWLAPAALIGIGLIALPLAIHLLVRQQARTVAFPSLRFLRETQLAAFRRRRIQDAALLLCRIAIIALAAVALAGPILQMSSRTAGYARRTSRAIVVFEGAEEGRVATAASGAFTSAAFRRTAFADALRDAVQWLDQQPPSSREIVVAGTLRRGSITDSELAAIPLEIGVRFESVAATSANEVTWPVLTRRDGALVRIDRTVYFATDATRVTDGPTTAVAGDLITIVAREQDSALAQAALRAALDAGVPWSEFARPVVIVWAGAEAAPQRLPPGARQIRMPVPTPSSAAADAVLAVLSEAAPRPNRLEPVMIAPEQLSAWSRPPGAPAAFAPLADEGDRRWLWGAVLALLAIEAWVRRQLNSTVAVADGAEARVA